MITRTVEVGSPARLRLADRHLVVERSDAPPGRVPLEDLGVLVIDHPEVILSEPLLVACAQAGVVVVVCDGKHLPAGQFVACDGHSLHAKVVAAQADARRPSCKRLWQRIVQAKIRAQSDCLRQCVGNDGGLSDLVSTVRSGDPRNVEARAARDYWPRLFGPTFLRDRETPGINAALNYGYAVLRAAVARAIVGSGLHPALGIHHSNQYNGFCLADDLIEPLRPLIDAEVVAWTREAGAVPSDLDRSTRHRLLRLLGTDLLLDERRLTLNAALSGYTASVVRVLMGDQAEPAIPTIPWDG